MTSAKEILLNKNLQPKKSFGQNFMLDHNVNIFIADAVKNFNPTTILEIGPGTGSLTKELLKKNTAAILHIVERDRDLIPILNEQFQEQLVEKKLVIHEACIKKFDLKSIIKSGEKIFIVGNLPYHLSSSILIDAIYNYQFISGAIFLLQKEVVTRICSSHNEKNYGFLSAALQYFFTVRAMRQVNKNAFWPIPKVDSAILALDTSKHEIQIDDNEIKDFLQLIKSFFQYRRKKLSTAAKNIGLVIDFVKLNIDCNLRPENLTPKDFSAIFQASKLCLKALK